MDRVELLNNVPLALAQSEEASNSKKKKFARFSRFSTSEKIIYIVSTVIVILLALTMLFPFYWMFASALKSVAENMSLDLVLWSANPNWGVFEKLFNKYDFGRAILNTVIIEISIIPVGTFVSSLAAFAFAKMHFRHKKALLITIMVGMMIPYSAVMLPQYRAYDSMGLIGTLWPIIIPGLFGRISMMFFLITYMKGAIHDSIIESAKIDGSSFFRMYWQIALPLAKNAIFAQIIFWFVGIWNDYFAPSLYLTNENIRTVQVVLNLLNSDTGGNLELPVMMAGAFVSSIPMIIFFLIFRNMFVGSITMSGVKE